MRFRPIEVIIRDRQRGSRSWRTRKNYISFKQKVSLTEEDIFTEGCQINLYMTCEDGFLEL